MIKALANEFVKNIKMMFRNFTSLSLLILAPLILILLIGYAFSSEDISGINIGVISKDQVDLEPLVQNVSAYAEIFRYDDMEQCRADLILQKMHICIGIEGLNLDNSNAENVSEGFLSGKIIYHYDNSRKKVSLALIDKIQEFFGIKAEQISIETASSIIRDIQNLITFIEDRKGDVTQIKNESMVIRADLVSRKENLELVRDEFMPSYLALKSLQSKLHNNAGDLNDTDLVLSDTVQGLKLSLQDLRMIYTVVLLSEVYGENLSVLSNVTDSLMMIDEAELALSDFEDYSKESTKNINDMIAYIDDIILKVDGIKLSLDDEIKNNDEYIKKIDLSIEKIDAVSTELESKLSELNKLSPETAERLVKPILSEYNMLLQGKKNIQISFPQLLVMIIMFIALLFSNISTLMEIHSKAHFRNLISPVNDIIYTVGLFFTSTVIVFFQIIVLFIVAQTRFGIDIISIFPQMCLLGLLVIMFFVLVGMIFAYLFKTVQSSVLITTFSLIIFFLFSSTLAPPETMPIFARLASTYNPLSIGEFLVREVQLFNVPLSALSSRILLMLAYITVMFVAVIILAKGRNQRRG